MSRDFEKADFYSCLEFQETLVHESPEDAIIAHFDAMEGSIEDGCPVAVYGFTRVEVDLGDFADVLADRLEEAVLDDDEIGFSENGNHVIIRWDRKQLTDAIASAIGPFSAHVTPWSCEQTSRREYTFGEVCKMLPASWTKGSHGKV